jgi:hypothetical protein
MHYSHSNGLISVSPLVCVKVVDDVKAVYAKLAEEKGKKTLAIAESAVDKHCGSKKLSPKDNKLVRRTLRMWDLLLLLTRWCVDDL